MFKKSFAYILTFCFLINLIPFVSAQTFSDVTSSHPYYAAIESLAEQGVVGGYADKTFQPERPVNRAEILKMLLLSANIEVTDTNENSGFPDVSSKAWYAQYVLKAKNQGIVKGNPDGRFAPEKQVNFAEALKMLTNTNNLQLETNLTEDPFADVSKEVWFAPYFQYAKITGMIKKTSEEKAEPGKSLNRGEIAQLIFLFQQNQKKPSETNTINTEKQIATYYADDLVGKLTASGEIFDQTKLTGAHKTLPFGTQVKVTNLENNESVIITINDRGPYNSDARYVLDLSKAAFQAIAPLSRGLLEIKYEVVTVVSASVPEKVLEKSAEIPELCQNFYEKKTTSVDFFPNFTLVKPLPGIFRINEVYNIRGQQNGTGDQTVTVFFVNQKTKKESVFRGKSLNGVFDIPIFFQQTGNFDFGIIQGESGQSLVTSIQVITLQCTPNYTTTTIAPTELKIEYAQGQTKVSWKNQNQKLTKIELKQNAETKAYLMSNGQNSLILPYRDFANFTSGEVWLTAYGADASSDFSVDQSSTWITGETKVFTAVEHHQILNNTSLLENLNFPETYTLGKKIYFKNQISTSIASKAEIILPSGLTDSVKLLVDGKSTQASTISPKTTFEFDFTPSAKGIYILEINDNDGLAVINLPIYETGVIPLLPDLWDEVEQTLVDHSKMILDDSVNDLLNRINTIRDQFGLKTVVLNKNLSQLAQARANDMAQKNYFSHQNSAGKYVNDLKFDYGIKSSINENIAKDTDLQFAHNGLMRSASHRGNILNSKWTRVGIGIAVTADGYLVITEEFSEDEMILDDLSSLRNQVLAKMNLKRQKFLVENENLNTIAQTWSETILNREIWFEDPQTGLSLLYLLSTAENLDNQNAGAIFKGDFQQILTKIANSQPVIDLKWIKVGIGISQNKDGTLNVTIIYMD